MKPARSAVLALSIALLGLIGAAQAAASPAPAWHVSVIPTPANIVPGGEGGFLVKATNVGGSPTSAPTTIELALPPGLDPTFGGLVGQTGKHEAEPCELQLSAVVCNALHPVASSNTLQADIVVQAAPGLTDSPVAEAAVRGGGAAEARAAAAPVVQSEPVAFGFLAPLQAPFTEDDGSASTLAASHPYQQTIFFEFPTRNAVEGGSPLAAGHVRDIHVDLPAGLVANPSASPALCTEVAFEASECPVESAVGTLQVTAVLAPLNQGGLGVSNTPLYNLVPPPGYPAALGTNIAEDGLFVHLLPLVRSDGDYGISVDVPDVVALTKEPVFGSKSQIWGDPSSPLHNNNRGVCAGRSSDAEECPVAEQQTAFWTLPSRCDGQPLITEASADSWEEPGLFHSSHYESADLAGNPVSLSDCGSLSFAPTIEARPTTNLADSPSGLDVDLHQPQSTGKEERSNPPLRDATVTLPAGMAVNPSQADGLAACSESEIGLLAEAPEPGIHFNKQPNSCPDASKLGTVEVTTPLLAQRDSEHRLQLDPETGRPIPRVLRGAVYLAQPFANPLGSLLALYLTVEDPGTGTVAKLAGEVRPDPQTGQLTTVFEDNPQLPIEDIRLHLFGGARGSLITPPTCGTHTTTTDLEPWSAPDTPDATPTSSFQTSQEPGGGSCPASEAAAPNSPSFAAGTLNPQAGAYSPFVLKVSREDGSQRLAAIDTTLAPGLTGKLAGVPECSEAQIAAAAARSHPEEGRLERESPSCPLATEVGVVTVGAGAGPTPFYTQGHAYLAGPYKGAPVSLAIITPAVAGPFDLGTVVTRVALHVDPDTAQIHAVSDPLPTILDGIPLDVRSVALKMDRPNFTLNPTSCDPLAITGTATSALGQGAALTQRFQVGGCRSLAFKPKLSLRLKGSVKRSSNPKLVASLKAKPGEANVAAARVKLPHPVFLDQAHIRTICTRVQFAADACPSGSVYGRASATTPLLDSPLSGAVYLRSNPSHELPDLVAKLRGPASQPIEIDLAGRTDAVKAALRNTFEAVPDAPVTSFRLELFGGKRGLVEMSQGFCADRHATVQLTGQNGKTYETRPVVGAKCPKHRGGRKGHRHHKGGR
jgi:hypothetical protein